MNTAQVLQGITKAADINHSTAAALGLPKLEYVAVERERRWLCHDVPRDLVRQTEAITDLYVTGTRLRLREARLINGGLPLLRLSRKADVDTHTRLITSIYLSEEEFGVLALSLPGIPIKKLSHRLGQIPGVAILVDEFQGDLQGLIVAEAEFETLDALTSFTMSEFAVWEVTNDPRFTGAHLAKNGLP